MRKLIMGAALLSAISLAPGLALAQSSTVTGAAGGAVAGAVVGGPVGAVVGGVAGGAVGAAAGNSEHHQRTEVVVHDQPSTVQRNCVENGAGDRSCTEVRH